MFKKVQPALTIELNPVIMLSSLICPKEVRVSFVPGVSITEILLNKDGLYEGNLVPYFRAVFKARNASAPYHNFRHICHVLVLCYSAVRYYGIALSKREVRNLFVAALFHDFDHTGKKVNDSINIDFAIKALRRHLVPEDEDFCDAIVDLIRATEFPHQSGEQSGLLVKILRDADLCQAFSSAWILQVVYGLAEEWQKDPWEILKMQPAFLSGLEFETDWARVTFSREVIDRKISEALELIQILG